MNVPEVKETTKNIAFQEMFPLSTFPPVTKTKVYFEICLCCLWIAGLCNVLYCNVI